MIGMQNTHLPSGSSITNIWMGELDTPYNNYYVSDGATALAPHSMGLNADVDRRNSLYRGKMVKGTPLTTPFFGVYMGAFR